MSKLRNPNEKLRHQRELRGWSQRKVAAEIGTAEKRVSAWECGESAPSAYYQEKLCLLFGKNTLELGLLKEMGNVVTRNVSYEESDGCFSFGKLKTTWMVLDGDGTESYLPQHIHTYYDNIADDILPEIVREKQRIEDEEQDKEKQGLSYRWNGEQYHLSHFYIGRESLNEDMVLNLSFKPSDYYTFLAKDACVKKEDFREKYLPEYFLDDSISHIPSTVGVEICLLTSDGQTIITQRGKVNLRKGFYASSVAEGLSKPLDKSTTSQAPDLYRCACRGLAEELGLEERKDFSLYDVHFLSFGMESEYIQWNMIGMVKVAKTSQEILKKWEAGVKDKRENRKIYAIPFTPKSVCDFVFAHSPWTPTGLICLYHALVHEFGREEVERVVSSSM